MDEAEGLFRKALEIDEKARRLEGMANHLGNLGNLMRLRGDFDGAEQMYRQALDLDEKLGRLEGLASDYGNLGNLAMARRCA